MDKENNDFRQAIALFTADRHAAVTLCWCVIERAPDHADAWALLGRASLDENTLSDADRHLRRSLTAQPGHAAALNDLADLRWRQGDAAGTARALDRTHVSAPNNRHVLRLRAGFFRQTGKLDAALADIDRVIALADLHWDDFVTRGDLLTALGRLDAANAAYARAGALNPSAAKVYLHRANAAAHGDRFDTASNLLDRARLIRPDLVAIYLNRGNVRFARQALDRAATDYRCALILKPDHQDSAYNLANTLVESDAELAALRPFNWAVHGAAPHSRAWVNRGNTLLYLKQYAAAVASYDRAIAATPTMAEAHWRKSLALLTAGEYARAWPLYEWRWRLPNRPTPRRNFTQLVWRGRQPLTGKTLLLTAEQGYGDMIQFCRYLPDLITRAGQVVVEMPPPLIPLVAAMDPALKVIATDAPSPHFDMHCPLMSLPLALTTRLETIPGAGGYLRADLGKIRRWRQRLGAPTGPRVGLVWHTTSPSKNSPRKSVALAELRRHLPAGADYVSLQKEHTAADLTAAGGLRLFGDDLHDFSETAALIAEMDLVISIDTSTAHLAGALGKPVWLLLHTPADWRWLDNRQDSPWYAHMRLYRQTRRGDWAPILARVAEDLAAWLKAAPTSPV
ncbi:MAG: tetratricopeptide repeat protein [Pseudomonadota bacterium]|nr:tetratricopeptide repeat protein [Pseudomonadota bacterium]